MTFLCLNLYKCSINTVNAQLHCIYTCLLTVLTQALKWESGRGWGGGEGGGAVGQESYF